MIVPAMTLQEIYKEVMVDIANMKQRLDFCLKDFNRVALKSKCYPIRKSYNYKTKNNNHFIVGLNSFKRSNWKNPYLTVFGIYSRPEGKYAVSPTFGSKNISIYPPHFFKRYRERIVKDQSLSSEELMKHFFKNETVFKIAFVNKDHKAVYDSFENNKEEKVSFVSASLQGYCFGERQGDIDVFKTIISEDMLFESQKQVFTELKKSLQDYIIEKKKNGRFS